MSQLLRCLPGTQPSTRHRDTPKFLVNAATPTLLSRYPTPLRPETGGRVADPASHSSLSITLQPVHLEV